MQRLLRTAFIAEIITELLLVGIMQFAVADDALAAPDGNALTLYVAQVAGVALVLVCVPLAFRMMRLCFVARSIAGSRQAYTRWALVRLSVLAVPMLFNTLAYYLLTGEATSAYLALISFVAMLFFWPTETRCDHEMRGDD